MTSQSANVQLSILSSMASMEFEQALDRHMEWGLHMLDLKDAIFGKTILELNDKELARAAQCIEDRNLSVYCLSTSLFFDAVEKGEAHFRAEHLARVARAVEVGHALKPRFIRLLAARSDRAAGLTDRVGYLRQSCAWLFTLYREAISRIAAGGFAATIENEVHGCLLTNAHEVNAFFAELASPEASFTWDVQNMWQMGTFPSLSVYQEIRDLVGYVHLKGGIAGEGNVLRWASALRDASWPVLEITRQVVLDGHSPVICLNPPHGEAMPGFDYAATVREDIAYLRAFVKGID